jgi:hypothetical protein
MLYKNTSSHATFVEVSGRSICLEPGQEIESSVPIVTRGIDPVIAIPKEAPKKKTVAKVPKKQKYESEEVTNGSRTETN